jgi:hypothetical protein
MATNTTGTVAREYDMQVLHFIRRAISFDTPLISTDDTILVGVLPAGAVIYDGIVKVTTAFNAATTNYINVGVVGDDDGIVDQGDLDLTAVEWQSSRRGCDLTLTSDTPVYVTYDQTGTAATTGAAEIIVAYIPDNDTI